MKKNGFTLIELMITVAVVAVLVAIALPQFLQYFAKARRTEGVTVLKGLYTSEIAYFGAHDSFSQNAAGVGVPAVLGLNIAGTAKFYNFTENVATLQGTPNIPPLLLQRNQQEFFVLAFGQIDTDSTLDILEIGNIGLPDCVNAGTVCVAGSDDVLQ